jgi:phage terminase large subunit-like protein
MSKRAKLEKDFEALVKQIKSSTPAEVGENIASKNERVQKLLADPLAFCKYYFPKWASSEFADFHKDAAKAILNHPEKKMILAWAIARNMSKTTFFQMISIWMNCRYIHKMEKGYSTGIWMSKTFDQAVKSLRAIRLQFEYNERLKSDFGVFKTVATWGDDMFITTQGISWFPLGKGQSPRGAKNEEIRPDIQIWDDFDDDEECLNDIRLDKSWRWMMDALLPTLDVSQNAFIAALNNIIAPKSLMTRVMEIADYTAKINLLDDKGKPRWKARHSLDDCMWMINKIGTLAAQKEYFNNPISEGKVFKAEWLQDKAMTSGYTALIAYLDPSFKSKKNADHKALVLLGLKDGEFHILKVYCDRATVEDMIEWHYELEKWVKAKNMLCEFWMEEVFLQDLLYKDFAEVAKRKGWPIGVQGDTRKKPDKDMRIGAMAGYFERGQIYFNEAEKDNHHMIMLKQQIMLFQPGNTGIKKDGPDALEGALFKMMDKVQMSAPQSFGKRARGKNMY